VDVAVARGIGGPPVGIVFRDHRGVHPLEIRDVPIAGVLAGPAPGEGF
jgi:hypothetical protein